MKGYLLGAGKMPVAASQTLSMTFFESFLAAIPQRPHFPGAGGAYLAPARFRQGGYFYRHGVERSAANQCRDRAVIDLQVAHTAGAHTARARGLGGFRNRHRIPDWRTSFYPRKWRPFCR